MSWSIINRDSRNQTQLLRGLNLNLKRLYLIRYIAMTGQTAALCFIAYFWPNTLAFSPIIAIIVVLLVINLLTYWRLKSPVRVTNIEFFSHLLIDLFGLAALLYFSGGANNPFVSYFLVPLCISAAVLPWRYTWFFAGLAMIAYSVLLFYYVPLETVSPNISSLSEHHHMHSNHTLSDDSFDSGTSLSLTNKLNLHIIGMWLNFLFSTGLITYFVVKMAQALKEQDEMLNQQIEQGLRDEQILSIATQAAGTAHELGTPLSTLTLLLEEVKHNTDSVENKQDIELMEQQVSTCRTILQRLSETAQQHNQNELNSIAFDQFFDRVLTHWQVITPLAQFDLHVKSEKPGPLIKDNPVIEQALINLFNNAMRVSQSAIEVSISWSSSSCYIEIADDGPGFPAYVLKEAGKPFSDKSKDGLGLGLMLTTASIEKNDGRITLENTKHGAKVTVMLPSYSR